MSPQYLTIKINLEQILSNQLIMLYKKIKLIIKLDIKINRKLRILGIKYLILIVKKIVK
jgi:hypothetical protein